MVDSKYQHMKNSTLLQDNILLHPYGQCINHVFTKILLKAQFMCLVFEYETETQSTMILYCKRKMNLATFSKSA